MSWKGNHGDNWPEWRLELLRKLWDDPANSTVTIARKLGVTKNACVGKAHRLDLAKRPNPIRSKDPAATDRKRQMSLKATILSGDHKGICRGAHAVKEARQRSGEAQQKSTVVQFPPKPKPVARGVARYTSGDGCQWLEGERPTWTKCGCARFIGSSWCEEHYHRVFQTQVRAAE